MPSRPALLPSSPRQRKDTHIPPPPIPSWALASRRPVAAPVQTPQEAKAQPPQATQRQPPRTPSGLEQVTRSGTDPATPPAERSELDSRGRQRGRPKGYKNKADTPADVLDRPRPKRVEARPNYRLKKTREPNPKKSAKSASPSPRDVYDKLNPSFVRFMCEWQGCPAELDSFAKLKKHIVVAHGKDVRVTKQCRWGKCGHLNGAVDANPPPEKYPSVQHLLRHVDLCHLDPILWHMGDGRRGHGIVMEHSPERFEGYLFWNGCQVTPSAQQQKFETLAELRERERKVETTRARAYANAPAIGESDLEDSAEEVPLLANPG